ncbi:MAG: hypothetical protein HUU55_00005 [Myxococcales bacterium]|nr:hypothetical protein [Myxococcales bacterium]
MGLLKATFQAIGSDEKGTPTGAEIPVQFNPTTLKLTIQNQMEGGKSKGKQKRQHIGSSSTKLTMQLVFDTSDEGTVEEPRSVREKTKEIVKFLIPPTNAGDKPPPPRLRFHWGTFIFDGIMENITEEVDLFAENGTPLRAKLDVSISEQKAEYQFDVPNQVAQNNSSAPKPGAPAGNGPGTSGSEKTNRTGSALDGESLQGFLARNGLDPSAWRSVADQVGDALSLPAGLELDFNASVNVSAGVGIQLGVQAGIGVSVDASLGLGGGGTTSSTTARSGAGVGAGQGAGFALSAAGGVGAALEKADVAKSSEATQKNATGFGNSAQRANTQTALSSTTAATATSSKTLAGGSLRPVQTRTALRLADTVGTTPTSSDALPAPMLPIVDRRAISFGYGVPLVPRKGIPREQLAPVLGGWLKTSGRPTSDVPTTTDPTVPGWIALRKG